MFECWLKTMDKSFGTLRDPLKKAFDAGFSAAIQVQKHKNPPKVNPFEARRARDMDTYLNGYKKV